ncbi:MAG TPA: Mur ligase family protein [Candidatus Saccharimonadales bacterium]|jgi:UDP-N-acetylmuramate--alanine ligase|nr:Mur ligase family protein [Candidatus Saccharimonadales bacterium]
MHVYFSGIGGMAIGPLALIAKQAGFKVSGSDKQSSGSIAYLQQNGIDDIHIGQRRDQIAAVHKKQPIDWFVYTSALTIENPHPPELEFCKQQSIKTSKRDEFINLILDKKQLELVAIAGTHGKTTTTAMVIWLFTQLKTKISYSVGAKMNFGTMGLYTPDSKYFVYEADEFDRNFLAFNPYMSIITGVTWDHHEIFPTREDYQLAFQEFISQSGQTVLWQEDFDYLGLEEPTNLYVQSSDTTLIENINLKGRYNRLNAWLAIQAVHHLLNVPLGQLVVHMNHFPGVQRRMEPITNNLYTDYAHTPEKIIAAMNVALEIADGKNVVVIYEPLTNRRQHYMKDDYKECFKGAAKVYWLPTYLAREDPKQSILTPEELIARLNDPGLASPAAMNKKLSDTIREHLKTGDMVVAITGGGGQSLDEWLRKEFKR